MIFNSRTSLEKENFGSNKNLRRWSSWILVILIIGTIGWVFYRQKDAILTFPWKFEWKALSLVFLFHSLALGATFWAWYVMMVRLGKFTDLRTNFRYYYVSNLTKRLPTSIPYIGTRLVMYRQEDVPTPVIINCVLLENLLIGIAGIIAFLLFAPFYKFIPEGIIIPMITVALILITLLLVWPRFVILITNWVLRRFHKEQIGTSLERRDILFLLGIYILPWLFAGASFYFAPRALSDFQGLSYLDSFQISTLATLASLLYFVIPGGLALKEITASVLLTAWMPLSTALLITIAYRLIHTVNELVWALIGLVIPIKDKQSTLSQGQLSDKG
jgi:hypothetical protein